MTNKEVVAAMYKEFFNDHDINAALKYVREDYIQHNPGVGQGRQALMDGFAKKFEVDPTFHLVIKMMIDAIVEIKGEKYVLWHYLDAYKVNDSVHATPLKDWEKLQKEYDDDMDYYTEFAGIFVYTYDDVKEMIEEDLEWVNTL